MRRVGSKRKVLALGALIVVLGLIVAFLTIGDQGSSTPEDSIADSQGQAPGPAAGQRLPRETTPTRSSGAPSHDPESRVIPDGETETESDESEPETSDSELDSDTGHPWATTTPIRAGVGQYFVIGNPDVHIGFATGRGSGRATVFTFEPTRDDWEDFVLDGYVVLRQAELHRFERFGTGATFEDQAVAEKVRNMTANEARLAYHFGLPSRPEDAQGRLNVEEKLLASVRDSQTLEVDRGRMTPVRFIWDKRAIGVNPGGRSLGNVYHVRNYGDYPAQDYPVHSYLNPTKIVHLGTRYLMAFPTVFPAAIYLEPGNYFFNFNQSKGYFTVPEQDDEFEVNFLNPQPDQETRTLRIEGEVRELAMNASMATLTVRINQHVLPGYPLEGQLIPISVRNGELVMDYPAELIDGPENAILSAYVVTYRPRMYFLCHIRISGDIANLDPNWKSDDQVLGRMAWQVSDETWEVLSTGEVNVYFERFDEATGSWQRAGSGRLSGQFIRIDDAAIVFMQLKPGRYRIAYSMSPNLLLSENVTRVRAEFQITGSQLIQYVELEFGEPESVSSVSMSSW